MTRLQDLDVAQVLLLAAQFISDVNIESLQVLAAERKDVLTSTIIYRLLLTLYPTDEVARSALLTLLRSVRSGFSDVSALDAPVDASAVVNLSPAQILGEARSLDLQNFDESSVAFSNEPLSQFIITLSHTVDRNGGQLHDVAAVVDEFSQDDEELRRWNETYLQPICRLRHTLYPNYEQNTSLANFEALSGPTGLNVLLQHAADHSNDADIVRDLDEVVLPWISGGSKDHPTAAWNDVFEWIFAIGVSDFDIASRALLSWNGPQRTEDQPGLVLDLAQTGFAVIYAQEHDSGPLLESFGGLLRRCTSLAGIRAIELSGEPDLAITGLQSSSSHELSLLPGSLMSKENALTRVSESSARFLGGVLKTAEILATFKLNANVSTIAKICLSANPLYQRQELNKILQQVPRLTTSEPDWSFIRKRLFWLQRWSSDIEQTGGSTNQNFTYLGKLATELMDTDLLDAMLASGHYNAARELYTSDDISGLASTLVEDHVVSAIYSAYDNASNGNRDRGGIKRASVIITTFKPVFPGSNRLMEIEHLLKATHSLSFYQLTLQHGVPFRPVNIRAQKDPLTLIKMLLEQDHRAYLKLDDLTAIGRNLVLSRSSGDDSEGNPMLQTTAAEHRITFDAISSALANDDFDTAYSYITSRLINPHQDRTPEGFVDDTSWRAAYAAGKYRPKPSKVPLHTQIASLSKRLELLSLALTLAPNSESLSEILGTWRRCEEEMDSLKMLALEEERAFEHGGDGRGLPGDFGMDEREEDAAETRRVMAKRTHTGNASYEEDAPVGLFEMARGAASALRKNAFPLHGGTAIDVKPQDSPRLSGDSGSRPSSALDGERMRKRDMVSNMVTSGLVSGMGWVLGAQPVEDQQHRHDA
jgi:protein transport protein SEC39